MLFSKTIKTVALAAAVVIATAGASMAAQYAWVDNNAKVKQFHQQVSPTVNWVHAGQKVKVIGYWNNWVKLQLNGPDGWVKKHVLDFNYGNNFPFPNGNGGSFCINGQSASFCLSSY